MKERFSARKIKTNKLIRFNFVKNPDLTISVRKYGFPAWREKLEKSSAADGKTDRVNQILLRGDKRFYFRLSSLRLSYIYLLGFVHIFSFSLFSVINVLLVL